MPRARLGVRLFEQALEDVSLIPRELVGFWRVGFPDRDLLDPTRSREHFGRWHNPASTGALYFAAELSTALRELHAHLDPDLVAGVASVQQTLYRLGKRLLVKEPKSNRSRRTVALAPILLAELRCIQDEQAARQRELADAYQDHGLVFCQPHGKPLHAHNIVRRDFRQVMARAGVSRLRFHDLRHYHATLLLQQGVHPKIVQERLDHSTISMTLDTYSHVVPGLQERAVADLEARLFGAPQTKEPSKSPR